MFKKKLLTSALVMTAVLGASSAYAGTYNHAGAFYVEPALGAWVDLSGVYDSSPIGALSVGYNLTDQLGAQVAAYGGATANAVMIEGIWNIPLMKQLPWRPYLAIGGGYTHMDDFEGGMDIGGGIRYQAAPNFDVSFNYRYMQALNGDLYNGQVITIGAKMYFGGSNYNPMADSAGNAIVSGQYALPKGVSRCDENTTNETRQSTGCYTVSNGQVAMHLDVKFDFDKSSLTDASQGAVMRLASFMKQYPETNVVLYGYASWEGKGSKSYNKKLSLKRANSVSKYLSNLGVENTRIKTVGMGIASPIASNETESGRALNRRVEAAINLPLKNN